MSEKEDVLEYYVSVLPYLTDFLRNKKIAVKNYIPDGVTLLKRGSELEPLYVEEIIKYADKKFFDVRKKIHHLDEARSRLNKQQIKIWQYFLPRKYSELFYATNDEGVNKKIERIFIDIDRTERSLEEAGVVTLKLLDLIKKNNKFKSKIGKYKTLITFTGKSFHLYFLLKKPITKEIYNELFANKENIFKNFCEEIKKEVKFDVVLGHIKTKEGINIDPSQTPSGKLARSPFSLHIAKDGKSIDGVTVPINEKILQNKKTVGDLTSYTPEKILKEIKKLAKNIPSSY
ncbi:hypothetical protein AUJ10_03315 [Candidatus Pacearchaeota archaeon CG1_02_31_27]|nr:MAG: hypothetical protein AUJ10_03315 [Candidatus Pacearchaeota archaeon CG1_02_31_27]PIN92436.1 MAG: hypothetical protein COU55_01375 [Candidatus Pacearchaeota archaeon CG10_big_fil_rev_8_21_14_0_10_31_59]PIZ81021.1 MAG: hypothetical protein COX99_01075 [Candidatus Pacearchaeota archaeon CG_4_10_14_0_2_um_filter_31_10]